jgi:DTW domain-containing protein
LVVLDATWRKSRKLLHCNPLLGTLPRLSLQAPPPSLYASLRKAQQPQHQRSTLEATALALQQLEDDAARYQPLLAAFEGFVAAQHLTRPQRTKILTSSAI